MKIEKVRVYGFEMAIFGMRNPRDSWALSDSIFFFKSPCITNNNGWEILAPEMPEIGPKDMELANKLVRNGGEHRKFLRQIQIWCNITIPRYMWQELDTYKIFPVKNSCSTMQKLGHRDLDASDFEEQDILNDTLIELNRLGKQYRETKNYDLVRKMKKYLPEGFLQMATYSMNYENALNIYFQRRNHRLIEWNIKNPRSICSFIASLPYMKEFIEAKDIKRNG